MFVVFQKILIKALNIRNAQNRSIKNSSFDCFQTCELIFVQKMRVQIFNFIRFVAWSEHNIYDVFDCFHRFQNVNRWSCRIIVFRQFVSLSYLISNSFCANRRQWICFSHVHRRCCFVSVFRWLEFKSSTSFYLIIIFFFDHNENFASIASLMMYDSKYNFIIFITFFFVLIVEILFRLHDDFHKFHLFVKFRIFCTLMKLNKFSILSFLSITTFKIHFDFLNFSRSWWNYITFLRCFFFRFFSCHEFFIFNFIDHNFFRKFFEWIISKIIFLIHLKIFQKIFHDHVQHFFISQFFSFFIICIVYLFVMKCTNSCKTNSRRRNFIKKKNSASNTKK